MSNSSKKTPANATEFEREQLRFLLSDEDVALKLPDINPSLAWLPVLAELRVIPPDAQLARWVEQNFAEPEAVRDVAANIRFFGLDTAKYMESRLNRLQLTPLLTKCWRLIIRHIRSVQRGALGTNWFDIAPRIKSGEDSAELLGRIADALKPKLRVGKRLAWNAEEDACEPEKPSDLMSIDFEIQDDIDAEVVLSTWPNGAPAVVDHRLLGVLTRALSESLAEAIEAGVDSDVGYGISDSDVPSVAEHRQNEHHDGFLPIVRVIADLWTRLVQKDTELALVLVRGWQISRFHLVRRLALFAATNTAIPAEVAAKIWLSLSQGEIFLTGSSVEAYRLIRTRWAEMSPELRQIVEKRIVEGPPPDWFRDDSDKERMVNHSRFEWLGQLQRSGIELSEEAQAVLTDLSKRWPQWKLRPEEQAGFHVWFSEAKYVVDDPAKLREVPEDQVVEKAKELADANPFDGGDAWTGLCKADPARALGGLEAQSGRGEWPTWAWRSFLWTSSKDQDVAWGVRIAKLLLAWPAVEFAEISQDAAWWLNENAQSLGEELLWPLWDRIEQTSPRDSNDARMMDSLTAALNATSGRLAEILLKKLRKGKGENDLPEDLRSRFDRLTSAHGTFGKLARVRLAAEVSSLFEQAPKWTAEKIVPLFIWSSPDAPAAWSARAYANYIGSPKLFELTKGAFLELFGRTDVSTEELRVFGGWLGAIMIANQSEKANYPIAATEARSALREAGATSLSSVAHRLAIEMEKAKPNEKMSKWQEIVGPVFRSIWPLDVELQTSNTTFQLVQILRASGNAFPEAVDEILPFIRADDAHYTTVYSISVADDVLYSSSPAGMLDVLAAVVGNAPTRTAYGLDKALERLRVQAPQLAETRKFQKLLGFLPTG